MKLRSRRIAVATTALLGTALTPLVAHAQDSTWNGPGTSFNTAGNWTPGTVPTNRAAFSNTGPTGIAVNTSTTLNQFQFGPNSPLYRITNTSTLTLNGIGGVGIDNLSANVDQIVNRRTMTLNNASTQGLISLVNGASSGIDALLTLNGTTQLGAGTSFTVQGEQFTIANGSATGADANTVFNDTSGADGISITLAGGTMGASGEGINQAVAGGGDAVVTFNDASHADNASFTLIAGGATASPVDVGALAQGGDTEVHFLDSAHADGATFEIGGNSVAGFGGFNNLDGSATAGSAQISFADAAHADNAIFDITTSSVTAVGGRGAVGTPIGTGGDGGFGGAGGNSVSILFGDDTHANGAAFTIQVGLGTASGGNGGGANTGAGGDGDLGQASGTLVFMRIDGNAHVDDATFANTAGSALATSGNGGNGGAAAPGGDGGNGNTLGGSITVQVLDNASISGTTFDNVAGKAVADGGRGGNGGGSGGNGGDGGEATAKGGAVNLLIGGTVTLGAGTVIHNTAGDAVAQGGNGGLGGSGGNGGAGGDAFATGGAANVIFSGDSSAGVATIVNQAGGVTSQGGNGGDGDGGDGGEGGFASAIQGAALVEFSGASTAGAATIENHAGPAFTLSPGDTGTDGTTGSGGLGAAGSGSSTVAEIRFSNNATGGSAQILNDRGRVTFNDTSLFGTAAAGGAHIENDRGTIVFRDSSSLGNGSITNSGIGGQVVFNGTASAGAGTIVNNSSVFFVIDSTAGNATITNNSFAFLGFSDNSDAVGARIINNGGDVNVAVNGLRIGSLSGSGGTVETNGNALQVGYLDLNDLYAGVIDGSGSLVKRGTGTFTVTGENTYSGGTTVEAGSLQIGNGGTTGSIVGDVTDNANVTFNRSDAVTFANIISGSGSLTKAGAGTLILTNANSYGGGTTISQGSLSIGNGGTTGSIVGNVTDNANLTFNRSDDLSFAGIISGSGSLTKTGAGVLVLTGANTYGGGTLVSTGSLQIGNAGTSGSIAGNVSVSSGAALVFSRTDNIGFAGDVSGAGQLTKLAPGTLTLTGNVTLTGITLVSGGALQIGNGGTTGAISGNILNNAILSFNRSDTNTYGGVISGSGIVTQAGAGTLVLTGANTYGGGTLVNGGTLQLSGSVASAVQVLAAGRLTGTGIVNGNIVASGQVAPGTAAAPFGTLTATGAVTFNAGSFLAPTISAAGQGSLLQAGSLVINGGQVRPTAVPGGLFLMQTDVRIANGTSGRTGTFTGVDEAQLPSFLDASLSYVGNDVFLRVRRNATTFSQATGLTPNQSAVSTSLDAAVAAGNPLVFATYLATYNALLPLSGAQLQGALDILSGDALTAFPVAAQEHANRFAERLNAYTWSNSSNLWGLIAYGDQDADGDGNGPGFKANGVEFQIGFNTSLGHDTRLGLSVGMNNGDVSVADRLTNGNVDSWSVGAQLRHDFGPLYVSGQFTYSWHSIDSSRPLLIGGTATADYDANSWTAGGEIGWAIRSNHLSIEPYVSVRHASTSTDAYSETGSAGALDVAVADYETTRLGIGLRLANRDPETPVRFHLMARYERETGDEQSALDNALPGLPTFRVVGTRLGDNIVSGEVGAEFRLSNGLSLFAAGSGHTRGNETSLQANAGLRIVF